MGPSVRRSEVFEHAEEAQGDPQGQRPGEGALNLSGPPTDGG
jgi:hypothetical protein